jgi:hypothetical protein
VKNDEPAPSAQVEPPREQEDSRAAAWARLAAPARKPKAAAKPAPKPAPARPAPKAVAAAHPAAAAAAGSGPCIMSVGSKPPADVWLDERNLGRRTPLVGYRVACGDHKLVLKRADLDIYQMEIVTLRAGAHFKKVYPLQ